MKSPRSECWRQDVIGQKYMQPRPRASRYRFRWSAILALSAWVYLSGSCFSARAAEIYISIGIPLDMLNADLASQLYTQPDGVAAVWHENDCRYLYLDHPRVGRQDKLLRFVSHGVGNAGTEIFGKCVGPFYWRGFIEILATPYVTPDWQLRLQPAQSTLYDEEWKKGIITGTLWDISQHYVLPHLSRLTVDLAPPREEILSLVRVSVAAADAGRLDAILRSAAITSLEVEESSIKINIALTVPESVLQKPALPPESEAPLSAPELEAIRPALERWDAFLVFTIKDIIKDIPDQAVRRQFFDLLFDSRYEIVPILAGKTTRGEGDPVRRLFIDTWRRVQEIVRGAEQRGIVLDKVLRYAAFIRAGDALLAIDQAAPGLGIEISAEGLRRLARILAPEAREDPLQYSLDPDPALRALFGFPADFPEESPGQSDPPFQPSDPAPTPLSPQTSLEWLGIANAAETRDSEIAALKKRLNRWVPEDTEFGEYADVMKKLLERTADQESQRAALVTRHQPVFQPLVQATAMKESCWRQFVRKSDKITYVLSPAGSIGLMQINPFVWRGFYRLDELKWNAVYNAKAGGEILAHYLSLYGAKEENTGKVDNIARATYAAYNAGPQAVSRYRDKASSRREKQVDEQFWAMYQGFKKNDDVDLAHCTVGNAGT